MLFVKNSTGFNGAIIFSVHFTFTSYHLRIKTISKIIRTHTQAELVDVCDSEGNYHHKNIRAGC